MGEKFIVLNPVIDEELLREIFDGVEPEEEKEKDEE